MVADFGRIRWPTEREEIDHALELVQGLTDDQKLRRTLSLCSEALRYAGDRPDPIGEAEERLGNERLQGWIRWQRERRATRR